MGEGFGVGLDQAFALIQAQHQVQVLDSGA